MQPIPLKVNPAYVSTLETDAPDSYWEDPGVHEDPNSMIAYIGIDCPLELVQGTAISDRSPITGMTLSPDGTMLVTFSNSGSACFWDLDDFSLVQVLRDTKEEDIDELYVGRFTPNSRHLVVGGKLKDRQRWSEQDEDNHILPCPLKVFDLETGQVIERLEGHEEEVLCIKSAVFKGQNYFLSTSQDGYIIKWHVSKDWTMLLDRNWMRDGVTCMAFTVSFLPHTGNKYFVAACDDNIRLYDFEHAQVVRCLDFPQPPASWANAIAEPDKPMFAYLISRGVEMLDAENSTVNSIPNTVRLHKLVYPSVFGQPFRLEEERRYHHEMYRSNSWLIKVTSNGRYVAAPTYDGNVCLFNLETGDMVGILQDHDGMAGCACAASPAAQWLTVCCCRHRSSRCHLPSTPEAAADLCRR
ncbi:WD40-repeat-containing domain protein [Entophlyctis helioformis]|nr:WD40-repeat-containing domain protein [Entophlyctis helioformis]